MFRFHKGCHLNHILHKERNMYTHLSQSHTATCACVHVELACSAVAGGVVGIVNHVTTNDTEWRHRQNCTGQLLAQCCHTHWHKLRQHLVETQFHHLPSHKSPW